MLGKKQPAQQQPINIIPPAQVRSVRIYPNGRNVDLEMVENGEDGNAFTLWFMDIIAFVIRHWYIILGLVAAILYFTGGLNWIMPEVLKWQ
ncbi:MAG: hypothetical protein PHH26_00375 [Candidatus Thermoplasmatota archaeon]|nr:hypothetical protein [Candidatus Thermoplasmatota archaeon]